MTPYRITLHCSDTPNGKRISVDEIRKWHLAKGWRDIGYHLVVYPDGRIAKGRPILDMGAHVEGANEGNVGVCLNGRDRFTADQFSALRSLLDKLFETYDIDARELHCHYEFESAKRQGKTCPNIKAEDLSRWYFGHSDEAIAPYILEEEHA